MARRVHEERADAEVLAPLPRSSRVRFPKSVTRFVYDTSGATMIEYTLIVGLIFLAIVGGLRYYADRMGVMYQRIGTAVAGAT